MSKGGLAIWYQRTEMGASDNVGVRRYIFTPHREKSLHAWKRITLCAWSSSGTAVISPVGLSARFGMVAACQMWLLKHLKSSLCNWGTECGVGKSTGLRVRKSLD